MKPLIYIIDDDADQIAVSTAILEKAGFVTRAFEDPRDALDAIELEPPDAVLTDVMMPEVDGIEVLRAVRAWRPTLPVIVLTGVEDGDVARAAVDAGASDFIPKPPTPSDLVTRVERAIKNEIADRVLHATETKMFDALVGSHPRIEEVRRFVGKVAAVRRAAVLLLGESGTGKNLVARAIHRKSQVGRFQLVEINCAALPAHLVEAELFGYEKGAFTGAGATKKGLVEQADGGTLFLDEVGTLATDLQAKLLAFLESKRFRRLGSTQEREADLRIVAATNSDLEAAAAAGDFREDLFHRLNVGTITLPPLREIRSDIPELSRHFLAKAANYFGKPEPVIDPTCLPRLMEHDWPGNARELRNVIERALIFSDGPVLRVEPLTAAHPEQVERSGLVMLPRGLTLMEVERRYVEETLVDTDGRVGEAAKRLGVTRKVLWARRKRHSS